MKIGVAGLIFNEQNHILMMMRDDSHTWALPGGMLEQGELPPHGLMREVQEETSVTINVQHLIRLRYWPVNPDPILQLTFRCTVQDGTPTPSDEALEVAFFAPDKLPSPMLKLHRDLTAIALAHQGPRPAWTTEVISWRIKIAHFVLINFLYRAKNLKRRWQGNPYIPPPLWSAAVEVIIADQQGNILWVKESHEQDWALPSGPTRSREAPWEAAARVALTQTGQLLELNSITSIIVNPIINPLNNLITFIFTATIVDYNPKQTTKHLAFFKPGEETPGCQALFVQHVAEASKALDHVVFRVSDKK